MRSETVREFKPRRLLYRSWLNFRIAYGRYVALLLGIANTIVLLYRLGVRDIGFLSEISPFLTVFAMTAIAVAVPVSTGFCLYHTKRTGAFAANASLSTEQNPYVYKVVPRKKETLYPRPCADPLVKILEHQPVTDEEKREFEEAIAKTYRLLEGRRIRTD